MKSHLSRGDRVFNLFNYLFLALFSLSCLYPFYYILIYSLSTPAVAEREMVVLWPVGFTLHVYLELFNRNDIAYATFISVSRTAVGTAFAVVCTAFFAFLLSQEKLRLRKLVYRFTIATMFLNAGLIPNYLLLRTLGLQNNFLVYIIPNAVAAFNVILVKTYIEQTPYSLQESAKMDGAGWMTIFYRIMLPVISPVLAVIAIFTAINQWSSWFDNFILADIPSLRTLAYTLYLYLKDTSASDVVTDGGRVIQNTQYVQLTPKAVRMAITMVVTFPILLVYPLFQRYFVSGIMIGSMKG